MKGKSDKYYRIHERFTYILVKVEAGQKRVAYT